MHLIRRSPVQRRRLVCYALGVRKAFEVRRAGRRSGELFEGRGPFISTARFAGPNPIFACAFASTSERDEATIAGVLQSATGIDDACEKLIAAGFELSPIDDPDRTLPIDSARSPLGDFRG